MSNILGSVGGCVLNECRKSEAGPEITFFWAESEGVSSRIKVKSPARSSVEGAPKRAWNRERAWRETVSDTPMSWFPGSEATYGYAVD